MKTAIKIFIYGSIIALLIYLYNIDYLVLKDLNIDYLTLSYSFIFLFLGFIFSSFSWKVALKLHGVDISIRQAIFSHGLPVFTKYIPGRIWTIIGRAALIDNKSSDIKFRSLISLKEQLIYLILGFLISIYPILKTERIKDYSIIIIIITIVGFFILMSKSVQLRFENTWNKIVKRNIKIPVINKKEFFILLWNILFYWILWSVGFNLLLKSLLGDIPFYYSFAFPLSVSLGLISIIFPGGIGIREGIISLFLISNNISPDIAVSIAIVSRLWFLVGEVFIFIFATTIRNKHERKD